MYDKMLIHKLTTICWTNIPQDNRQQDAMIQVMACCKFHSKPLPEPLMTDCQLNHWEQISLKLEVNEWVSD